MKLVVTGAHGFLGANLHLAALEAGHEVVPIGREGFADEVARAIGGCDAVFHLAGENRPADHGQFFDGNVTTSQKIAECLRDAGPDTRVFYASSAQVGRDSIYARTKEEAEQVLADACGDLQLSFVACRLPNVFGKWSRPNYNSVVATFCSQIARGQEVTVHDKDSLIRLAYVDDVCADLLRWLRGDLDFSGVWEYSHGYEVTVGELRSLLINLWNSRASKVLPLTNSGLQRALYATLLSYAPASEFVIPLAVHRDPRGSFFEGFRTPDCGQISVFTAEPGVERGNHYHHTKTERFVVVAGTARFDFTCLATGEQWGLEVSGDEPVIIESIPGWNHIITNTGPTMMVCVLWASELFDPGRPDTYRRDPDAVNLQGGTRR